MAYQIGSIAKEILNVANSFTKLFGLDMSKWMKGKKYDWSNMQQAVSKAFQNLEVKNQRELNEITKKMEELIQVPGGSNLRNVVFKAKDSLRKKYNDIQKKQAGVDLAKVRATNLANDISNTEMGDWLWDQNSKDKKQEFRQILGTADPSGSYKNVSGWENEQTPTDDDISKKVDIPV